MFNTGVIDYWLKYHKSISQFQSVESTKLLTKLKLFDHEHFAIYSYILLTGISISILANLFEYLFSMSKSRVNKSDLITKLVKTSAICESNGTRSYSVPTNTKQIIAQI